jgi:peptide/nickel transport system substrate-binding protein
MSKLLRIVATAVAILAGANCAYAQKQGGILKLHTLDSPASMSIHEEATVYAERPVMAVFNNLVLFDQHVEVNSMSTIRPELATDWAWDEDGTKLVFRQMA